MILQANFPPAPKPGWSREEAEAVFNKHFPWLAETQVFQPPRAPEINQTGFIIGEVRL
jgi:hypothetical protein